MEPYDPITPEPIDPSRYEAGFAAKLRGESLLHLNWLDASWRAGWFDAGKEAGPTDLKPGRRKEFPNKRKGK